MTSAHGIGEKLECPLCPKKLMTPNNLSGHLKTVHARESVTNKCFICFKEHPTKVKAIACEVAHRKEKVRAKCQSYHFAERLAKSTKRRLTSLNIYCRNRTYHGMEVILNLDNLKLFSKNLKHSRELLSFVMNLCNQRPFHIQFNDLHSAKSSE